MFHAQKSSPLFARRPLHLLLVCAGLASTPFAMAAVSATPVLASATAVQTTASYTATTVTFKVPYSGATPAWVRVFIDSDRIATSGFKTNSIGANFMVENGNLYRYTGSNGAWGWTFVKLANNTSANGLATVLVNRADIGASATTAAINVVTQTDAPLVVSPILRLSFATTSPTPTPTPTRPPRRANPDANADPDADANANANATPRRRRRRRRPRPRRRPQRQRRHRARPFRSITRPAARPSPIPSAASTATSAARRR
jgi:hypothetical protein